MDDQEIQGVISSLEACRSEMAYLAFWRENPELEQVKVSVSIDYDDSEYFLSREISDIKVPDRAIPILLQRLNIWDDSCGNEEYEGHFKELLEEHLSTVKDGINFEGILYRCDEETVFGRPSDDIEKKIEAKRQEIRTIGKSLLKGISVYVVTAPVIEYDDSTYSPSVGGEVVGVFHSLPAAVACAKEWDFSTLERFNADEVGDGQWWPDVNPDDTEDPDQQLLIWQEHCADFMCEIKEIPLQ